MKKMSELGISAISKLFLQQNAKISESKIKILGEYFDFVGGGSICSCDERSYFFIVSIDKLLQECILKNLCILKISLISRKKYPYQ